MLTVVWVIWHGGTQEFQDFPRLLLLFPAFVGQIDYFSFLLGPAQVFRGVSASNIQHDKALRTDCLMFPFSLFMYFHLVRMPWPQPIFFACLLRDCLASLDVVICHNTMS